MRIVSGWRGLPDDARGAAVAIGNFDGVHQGHQAVLAAAREAAGRLGVPTAAAVFDPHPRRFFQPDAPPFRLMTDRLRAETLAGEGVDILYVLPFDADFRSLSDADFARDVLSAGLGAAHVVTGAEFRFGQGRAGNAARLAELGAEYGFGVSSVAPVGDGDPWSSTRVRQALREGDCETATEILGRPWIADGVVIHGEAIGRTYGFPTANLRMGDLLRPQYGVYAARARIDGAGDWLPAAVNLGERPTIAEGLETLLEAFLLDFEGDLYGKRLDVALHHFIRTEWKFDGLDPMIAQIARDVEECRALLGV